MNKASLENMRWFENRNMEFITKSINSGTGVATYILADGEPDGFWRKQRMKWFGVTYICPYIASFIDTGTVHQERESDRCGYRVAPYEAASSRANRETQAVR